jgi:hypothetical protein
VVSTFGTLGHADLVAQPGGEQLGVEVVAQLRGRQDEVIAELVADPFGLLVEEHHRDLRPDGPGTAALDERPYLGVFQQPVVDLLAAAELEVRLVPRGEHARMRAVPAVVVGDVAEVPDPPVQTEQVERGGADEVDRHRVGAEEVPHLGDVAHRPGAGRGHGRTGRGVRGIGADADLGGTGGRAAAGDCRRRWLGHGASP